MTCTCTGGELLSLSALLGGDCLVGVADPFTGWLTEEIQEARRQARRTLIARGYLLLNADGQTCIDARVAALVGTVTFPATVFLCDLTAAAGAPLRRVFYWQPPMTVRLSVDEDSYRLDSLGDPKAIYREIIASWGLDVQPAAECEPLALPGRVLEVVRQHLAEGRLNAASVALIQAGATDTSAQAIVDTLRFPVRSGAVIVLQPEGRGWYQAGLGVLEGKNGMWRLCSAERNGEPWIELLPSSASELVETLHSLIARFVTLEPLEQ